MFVSTKIYTSLTQPPEELFIALEEVLEIEKKRDEAKEQIIELEQSEQIDYSEVANARSNEAAEHEQMIKEIEARNSDLLEEAKRIQQQIEANRAEYNSGLAQAAAIQDQIGMSEKSHSEADTDMVAEDGKAKGNVTVSYSLINPVRHARRLVVPSYRCQGGGKVIVSIVVDRYGRVEDAKIMQGGDECMQQSALYSALKSDFNADNAAPMRHRGTITYIFVAQ
ncbi:MAG: energy transducer TonB [Rikenellaceae bacterium]